MNIIPILLLIVLTSVCDATSQTILKSSINSLRFNVDGFKKAVVFVWKLIRLPLVWLGFFFSTLSLLIWLFVLSKADLSFAFSVDSMHYIFIAFASGIILKEKVDLLRWTGTLLIVTGIIIVTLG